MKNIYIFLLFQLFVLVSFAQEISGYQGKRFIASYDLFLFPAVINPTGEFYEPSVLSFNKRHSLGVDYVISRSSSAGVNFQILNTGFTFDLSGNPRGAIAAKNAGIFIKYFHRNDIAPLGLYSKIELLYLSYDVSYSEKRIYKNSGEFKPKLKNLSPYSAFIFAYSFGKQVILFDRLILNGSVQTAMSPKLLKGLFMNKVIDEGITSSNYIANVSQSRLFGTYFINFNIGMGFLIF